MYQFLPLLQAAAKGAAGKGGSSMTLIFILLIILIFYFFMIRPQQKKQKEVEKFRNGLQKGDKIITVGGIHGKIVEVKENTFIIEVANDIRLEIEKTAVAIDDQQLKNHKNEEKKSE